MKSMNAQSGFTMIEVLIALLGASLCALLCAQIARLVAHYPLDDYRVEDEIALKQLRLLLAQSEIQNVTADRLTFNYHGEQFRLIQYEDKLVKRKGFEVFMQDLDTMQFHREHACIFLDYQRDHQQHTAELACEE